MADDSNVVRNSNAVTLWRTSFLQSPMVSREGGEGNNSNPGSNSDIAASTGGGDEFRARSSSWSTWSRDFLWKRRSTGGTPVHRRQRGQSESESTNNTLPEDTATDVTPSRQKPGSTTDLVLQSVKHRQKSNSSSSTGSARNSWAPPLSPLVRSNSTDDLAKAAAATTATAAATAAGAGDTAMGVQQNLSFGQSDKVVYDIDGKFPYTYYESKPTFYDVDGVHRYKFYKPFQPTPYTSGAPHHETRPVLYDIDGKVTCYTMRDVQNHRGKLSRTKSSIQ